MSHTEALSAYKLQDFERAFELWLEESKQNNHQAMANLGLMYLKGEGVIKDFQKQKLGLRERVSLIMIRQIII